MLTVTDDRTQRTFRTDPHSAALVGRVYPRTAPGAYGLPVAVLKASGGPVSTSGAADLPGADFSLSSSRSRTPPEAWFQLVRLHRQRHQGHDPPSAVGFVAAGFGGVGGGTVCVRPAWRRMACAAPGRPVSRRSCA
jgi:hypothetical protein